MSKSMKKWLIVTSLIIMIPTLVGVCMWSHLPEQLPVHFNARGEVDGYASKPFVLFGLPLFLLALHVFIIFMSLNDPKNKGGRAVGKVMLVILMGFVPFTSLFVMFLTFGTALGYSFNVSSLALWFTAVIFFLMGNYLPKVRQNYFVGTRLPWTLNNPENWEKTNRMTGRIMVLCSVLIALEAVFQFGGETGFAAVIFIAVGLLVFIPASYSYWLYRKENVSDEEE